MRRELSASLHSTYRGPWSSVHVWFCGRVELCPSSSCLCSHCLTHSRPAEYMDEHWVQTKLCAKVLWEGLGGSLWTLARSRGASQLRTGHPEGSWEFFSGRVKEEGQVGRGACMCKGPVAGRAGCAVVVGALAAGGRREHRKVIRAFFTDLKSLVLNLWEPWKVLREGNHKIGSAF